jgi:Fic-DOC domain mobile mystery protein B
MSGKLMVGNSDGATPLDDVSGLIPKHIRTRAELFAAEAINISRPIAKYLAARPTRRSAPFTLAWALRLHREMFGKVWSWAGQRRQNDGLNIGVPCHHIDQALQSLLDDLAVWRISGTYALVERAARLHHRAVQIHPFPNGNGRWSRMLANIMLKQAGSSPTIWPEQTVGTSSPIRSEYLAAVRRADDHDYAPLIELHQRFTPPIARERK